MRYFGVNYCPRRHCASWLGWAWWPSFRTTETVEPRIVYRAFLRIFGVEFKIIEWLPTKGTKALWDFEVWRNAEKVTYGAVNPAYLSSAVHSWLGDDIPAGKLLIHL